jgi:AraC family transcriptional regulator of adaptative response / DNA-3-methyladenine glycosylase II
MRALSDPDAFLPADVGVLEALGRLSAGAAGGAGARGPVAAARTRAAKAATELAEGWRPWRSYAVQHLWASIEPTPENSTPSTPEKENQS